ncbi:MAG: zinc ribbon domain-containing protein [Methylobacillus sp.]|jgi:hypothetical protein|nr:zinc ribbon domain-containing protein [Methylobacillus sp.]
MEKPEVNMQSLYGLLRATEAVTNWRALVMVLIAAVATFLASLLVTWVARNSIMHGMVAFWISTGVSAFVAFIVCLIGYSSVGILLMRRLQNQKTGLLDALMQAIFTVHRLLGVAFLLFLIFMVVALVALLVLLVCKIPVVGSFLYALAFPILAVIVGTTIALLFYIGFPLAAPAVWEGNSTIQVVARLFGIARRRLLTVLINLVVLALIVGLISSVIFFILSSGSSFVTGLSARLGISPMGGLAFWTGGMGGMGYGSGDLATTASYTKAFFFATGLLFTMGAAIPFLVFTNGTCLIYLQAVEGLEFGKTEEKIQERLEEAKRRTQEARDRAQAQINEAKATSTTTQPITETASEPDMPPAAPIKETPRKCTQCSAVLEPDALFCGECGAKNPI